MFDTKRISSDFSRAASHYDDHAILQQHVLLELIEKAKPFLPPQSIILDAGSGTGRLGKLLAGHTMVHLDIALAMCRRSAKNGATVNGSVEALPFSDKIFDAVFSSLVLQWVPDWHLAMQEMRRVLKRGGIIAVSTFADGTLKELKESFAAGDRYPHVSEFLPREAFSEHETVTEYYPDLQSLMRHLKNIGARNKLIQRNRSLMTARQMQAVETYYLEHFGTPKGLPATWEILYLVERS